MTPGPRRRRGLIVELALAGDGAWLAANAYEGLVDVPQLLIDARARRRSGLLAPGSPVRYFALNGPFALVPTAIAVAMDWRRGNRTSALQAAGAVGTAVALSGCPIRTVNVPPPAGADELDPAEASRMRKRWHAVNALRMASMAAGMAAIERTHDRR